MQVRLLGPLEVVDGAGHLITIPGQRQRTVLGLLALDPQQVWPVELLIDELWGEQPPRQPDNALQVAVFKLRRAVGADVIETRPPGYVLCIPPDDVDAHRFERLARSGRAALAEGRTAVAAECFDDALGQWRGRALPGLEDVPAAVAAASRWEEMRVAVREDRFDALLALGRDAELVPDLDAAIEACPFRERLRGQLMLALYRSGRQADALRAARDARRVLADELGLEPGEELRRLEAAILAHDQSLQPSVPSRPTGEVSAPPPSNLRAPLTSFVGRGADLVGIAALLVEQRLVTLVGAGGCGKTRLAAEFAAAHRTEFRDGVWFVALDAVATGDEVAGAVAGALGLSVADTAGQPALAITGLLDRLRTLLAERVTLIVLDNCEHVIVDAARLAADLLTATPGLRLLATSREALRVPGEVVWRVPPLDADDAITLFADRARAARSQFELTNAERPAVGAMCERLDGMPLAIELAAARTSAFTVSQLADRLDDRFRIVVGGSRLALPRQQTLRAVTDWSYDLLFDDERRVFERLCVFVGGCSLEAAEAVCSDDRLPPVEVDGLVGRLVDKSLVQADGTGRFRMLQTLAQYGHERLAEGGNAATVRARHAAYYRDLAVASYGHLRNPGVHSHVWWLECLTTELDNIRAALEWSIGTDAGVTASVLAGHMGWYWWQTGRIVEGYRWLERSLERMGTIDARTTAPAVTWAARLALHSGHAERARELVADAIRQSEAAGDTTMLGMAWSVSGQLALLDGDVAGAVEEFEAARRVVSTSGDTWSHGLAALVGSQAATLRGDQDEARRQALVAIDVFRSLGDVSTLVTMLDQYGRMLESAGLITESEAAWGEARDLSEDSGLRAWQSTTSTRLGSLALVHGDAARATDLYREALELARDLALPQAELAALDGLGVAHRRRGELEEARRCHESARRIVDRIGPAVEMAGLLNVAALPFSRSQLGYVAEEKGTLEEAQRWHVEALEMARRLGDDGSAAFALEGLAGVAAATGDGVLAAALLGQADQLRTTSGRRLHGAERIDVERATQLARTQLGEDGFAHAAAAGRERSLDVVLAALAGTAR